MEFHRQGTLAPLLDAFITPINHCKLRELRMEALNLNMEPHWPILSLTHYSWHRILNDNCSRNSITLLRILGLVGLLKLARYLLLSQV
jgi:hypothetical protein